MNNVCLIGRITNDLELKYSQNQKEFLAFTVAVNRTFKNEKGEYDADFIRCKCFGATAKYIAQNAGKGKKVSVIGRMQTGSYERNGECVFTTDIMCVSVNLEERKENNGQNYNNNQGGFNNQNNGYNQDITDELPF